MRSIYAKISIVLTVGMGLGFAILIGSQILKGPSGMTS